MKVKNAVVLAYRSHRFMNNVLASGPFTNPLAYVHREGLVTYDDEDMDLLKKCEDSAKLIISEESVATVKQYFEEQRQTQTVMGQYYKSLDFNEFLLRLFTKRYKVAYLNGCLVVPRKWNDVLAKAKAQHYYSSLFNGNHSMKYRELLMSIGTEQDQSEIYREYLTLDEMMFTPCLLPQTLSVIIGNGTRSPYPEFYNEAHDAVPLAVINSPIGAEFNDGLTLHNDLLMMVVPEQLIPDLARRRHSILASQPLLNAAKQLYGEKLALDYTPNDARADNTGDFMHLTAFGMSFWLYKPAYKARTKSMLKNTLLSADHGMFEAGNIGDTFNLKGIGLGAFGFTEPSCTGFIEDLYVQCVQETVQEIASRFKHIRCINLINLPSDYNADLWKTSRVASYGQVQLIRSVMEPTCKKIPDFEYGMVGGTHFCGDSAAKVGNEGLLGAQRSNSDDPATLYSLLNPKILDPDAKPRLATMACLHTLSEDNGIAPLGIDESYIARHN